MLQGRRVVALTGAGCSTDSGIPDYRGPDGVQRKTPPIQYADFVRSEARRRRYWARSVVGWPRFSKAVPNRAHQCFAVMEAQKNLVGLITQNVDRLHHAAGSRRVVELHGALACVRCMGCGFAEARDHLQQRLVELNPWIQDIHATVAPDGDSELATEIESRFILASCVACEGTLKPDVVFFGENVSKSVTSEAWQLFDEAEVLLVAGTSLAVFSGYRFALRASERGVPIVIVNRGTTRGDSLATLKISAGVGETLEEFLR
jgi:NAD+-dependent protein deacetylase sirtuin 4